jgi:NADP-dependent 3-hydroxy acid dehydrogenase YdfG
MENLISLSGKLVLVTGASSGIGRATAIVLSQLGAKVILSGRSVDGLNETLAHTNSPQVHSCKPFDLSRTEEISTWISEAFRWGRSLRWSSWTYTVARSFHRPG